MAGDNQGHGRPPLALTIGEPAGIGPEIALKAWQGRHSASVPAFYLLADPDLVVRQAANLDLAVPVETATHDQVAACFDTALPVVRLDARTAATPPADGTDAATVVASIASAVDDAMAARAAAVVTNPIHKKSLYDAGFGYPGHTEFLAACTARIDGVARRPVMMLAGPRLRTVPLTVHVPLADVPGLVTGDLIAATARTVADDLRRRFAIAAPRLVVAGLNPHAGEDGALGEEDARVVAPAVAGLKDEGLDIRGPLPADTLFHAAARAGYDAAICMYHDQALVPAKTLDFHDAVNVTLGLPIVRTSPDHGTAFDIAGRGKADASSLIAALKLAAHLADNDRAHQA